MTEGLSCDPLKINWAFALAALATIALCFSPMVRAETAASQDSEVLARSASPGAADALLALIDSAGSPEGKIHAATAFVELLSGVHDRALVDTRAFSDQAATHQNSVPFISFVRASRELLSANRDFARIMTELFSSPEFAAALARATSDSDLTHPEFAELIENIGRSRAQTAQALRSVGLNTSAEWRGGGAAAEARFPRSIGEGDHWIGAAIGFALGDVSQGESAALGVSRYHASSGIIAVLESRRYVSDAYVISLLKASHEGWYGLQRPVTGSAEALARIDREIGQKEMDLRLERYIVETRGEGAEFSVTVGAADHWRRMGRLDANRARPLLQLSDKAFNAVTIRASEREEARALVARLANFAIRNDRSPPLDWPARVAELAFHASDLIMLEAFGVAYGVIPPQPPLARQRPLLSEFASQGEWKAAWDNERAAYEAGVSAHFMAYRALFRQWDALQAGRAEGRAIPRDILSFPKFARPAPTCEGFFI